MSRAKRVFKELGFSDEESGALAMKSDLHAKILRSAKGYSQAQLAGGRPLVGNDGIRQSNPIL